MAEYFPACPDAIQGHADMAHQLRLDRKAMSAQCLGLDDLQKSRQAEKRYTRQADSLRQVICENTIGEEYPERA
jgi:hypothetical protein